MPRDELVGAPASDDPRLHTRPRTYRGRTIVPLTRYPSGLQVYKQVFRDQPTEPDPEPLSHAGYLWFCVLRGRLRLILGDQDLVLGADEIAESHTTARTPTEP